jgi:hypothetical protein
METTLLAANGFCQVDVQAVLGTSTFESPDFQPLVHNSAAAVDRPGLTDHRLTRFACPKTASK